MFESLKKTVNIGGAQVPLIVLLAGGGLFVLIFVLRLKQGQPEQASQAATAQTEQGTSYVLQEALDQQLAAIGQSQQSSYSALQQEFLQSGASLNQQLQTGIQQQSDALNSYKASVPGLIDEALNPTKKDIEAIKADQKKQSDQIAKMSKIQRNVARFFLETENDIMGSANLPPDKQILYGGHMTKYITVPQGIFNLDYEDV